MAEVAESSSPDLKVLSVRHYEVAPPASQSQELVDPESAYATTKEEEWVTKKKTELTTTRQIETRVKRQVVLEDGKVVDDSGPIVTTNTTEDTEKQESQQTEHRTVGDDPAGEDWVAVAGPSGTLREVKERKVTTREEKEERVETEDVKHHGDITDEDYLTAVKSQQDIRLALKEAREESQQQSKQLVSASGPRVVHQSTKSHKTIDTEDTQELSQLQPDGRLVTETRRTTEHEEVHDAEEPDDKVDGGGEGSETEETFKESSSRYAKTKDQDLVEYLADGVKIGEEMRYVAENVEGERRGDPDLADQEWDSLSTRIRRMRRQTAKTRGIPAAVGHFGEPTALTPLDRKDALTKKPLDFDQEEETRKVETSKWLEHHFGSDSRSSKDSIEDDDLQATGTNTSFINVTMKSRPISANKKVSSMTSPVNGNASAATATPPPPTTTTTPKSYVATVNTSSRVFVSSPEPEEPASNGAGGYFQGVSEWSERSKEVRSPAAPQRPDRVQVLPTGPHHTFTPKALDVSYNNHTDRTSPFQHTNHVSEKTSVFQASNSSSSHNVSRTSPYPGNSHLSPDRSVSYMNGSAGRSSPFPTGRVSPYNKTVRVTHNESPLEDDGYHPTRRRSPTQRLRFSDREEREGEDTVEGYRYQSTFRSPVDKGGAYRSWERAGQEAEPPPDYSPEQHPRATPSPSPSPPPDIRSTPPPEATSSKKLYRRPRVNAEIPPPSSSAAAPAPSGRQGKSSGHSATSIIGESFRKLVGKFRTSSSERKNKRRNAGGKRGSNNSRSPSPRHQAGYNVTDSSGSSSIPGSKAQRVGRRGGDESPLPNEAVLREREREAVAEAEGGESSDHQHQHQPVAPPRSAKAQQVSSRHYRARGEPAMQRRFYLGEDPFGGSIYGREREYDGVTPLKSSRRHHRQQNGHRRGSHPGEEDDMNRANVSSSSSLGRLSKSTSRLATSEQVNSGATIDYSRTAQTLPRKLYDEHTQTSRLKKQVYLQKNGGTKQPHSNSMINVSIINNVTPPPSSLGVSKPLSNGVTASTGPAKPARTYRSNLARSKSFNVHAGEPGDSPSFQLGNRFRDNSTIYKSNPHLHRLDESPPPLKSPGILASISRSQRDLTDSATLDKEDSFTRRQEQQTKFSRSTSNLITNGYGNQNVNSNGSSQDAKKRLFMRELMDRAPELYKTLHGSDEDNDLKQPERKSSRSPVGRLYSSTPVRNGISNNRVLDYSSSFRSSSTNATPPESDNLRSGGRPLSSPFRPNGVNGVERVTSPSGSKSSFSSSLTHTPAYTNGARRGSSSNDDYSETVRITSKLDDPVRPSVTNTVQSFSKKTIPRKGGHSTETIESTETTTVTKSRFRGGDGNNSLQYLDNGDGKYAMRNGGGGVVIEVRPTRK